MNCWHTQQFEWISKMLGEKKPTSTVTYIYIYVVLQNDSDGRWQAGVVEV